MSTVSAIIKANGEMNVSSGAILQLIDSYGLAAVFLAILLEYACFPVPSEIVLPFAGAFASLRGIAFWQILLLSMAAGLGGCTVCYLAGRFGDRLLDRLGRRFPRLREGLDASRRWFDRYGGLSVMFGRVLPICRTYISLIAGLSRQNPVKFLAYSAVGIAAWNTVLVWLGFRLAADWGSITIMVRKYTYFLLPVVLVLIYAVVCRIRSGAGKHSGHP